MTGNGPTTPAHDLLQGWPLLRNLQGEGAWPLLVVVHGHSGGVVPELISRWLAPLAELRGAPVWVQALTAEPLPLPAGERLLVVPLLLTPGSHARFDLPAIRERLRAAGHPVVLLPFLGAWPLWLEHLGQLSAAEPHQVLLHHPLHPGVADRYLVALERRLGLPLSSEIPAGSSGEAGLLPLALAPNRMTAQLEDAGVPAPALLERPATRDLVFTVLRNLP
ncbi:CbiX/SirB N-terminal domain-containing protein [Synechococcus sp. CBW1107]|uniref:CbiX/SirB N-terminal domain-containing protein n=1 Tax=Synechococcus sp. CBW1107 TaxID=2789857 RepID=UPI002AD4E272|nr:CbiX/SirB N-terminal domain-containing protein [Synechococcus sp. CBW1107]CAK6696594.1 hypothetical protein MNNICLKF_02074 [Synechococcus sp. CBW1107]